MNVTTVKVEFGSRCCNHGLPECVKLAQMIQEFFSDSVSIQPCPVDFFNHFRVRVDDHLVFDAYSRYPPVIEVVKCIEGAQQEEAPAEIPYWRGIPFTYWRCPEHENLLVEGQMLGLVPRCTQRLSGVSFKVTNSEQSTSSSSSEKVPRKLSLVAVEIADSSTDSDESVLGGAGRATTDSQASHVTDEKSRDTDTREPKASQLDVKLLGAVNTAETKE